MVRPSLAKNAGAGVDSVTSGAQLSVPRNTTTSPRCGSRMS